MSWVEEVEVPWPVETLTAIGFSAAEAERLHAALPSVPAGVLAEDEARRRVLRVDDEPAPVAMVIWTTHNLSASVAVRLSDSGRDVLDLIAILDAVVACHPDRLWTPRKVALVEAWLDEQRAPLHRIRNYMSAGVGPAEAAHLEADPTTRPTDAQLATLAALRNQPSTETQ